MQCCLMRRNKEQIGEHESKFVLPNRRARILSSWLSKRCRPDPLFPVGIVSSIYFDTKDWRLLEEKLNSDHLKTKVRLRWYSDVQTGKNLPTTFLEIKYKIGSARKKLRINTTINSSEMLATRLEEPSLLQIPRLTLEHGVVLPMTLHPAFQLNYIRHRFVDPLTGARLAVDSNIHISRVNNRMIQTCNPTCLQEAVFELKYKNSTLPDWLHQLTALGCRKSSFSKYSNCYCHLTGIYF